MNYVNETVLAAMREGDVEFYVVMDEELGQLFAFEVGRNALVFVHDGDTMHLFEPDGSLVFTITEDNYDSYDAEWLSMVMDDAWGSEGFSERVTEEASKAVEAFAGAMLELGYE